MAKMIAIKDIKMPVNCEECFARILAWCRFDEEERTVIPALPDESFGGRPEWCPLVEFPDEADNCSEIPNSCENLQSTCNEVATDCISRRMAIDALLEEVRLVDGYYVENDEVIDKDDAIEAIQLLPSAQPEIIRCKECRYSKYDYIFHSRYCHNKGKAELVGENFFCAAGRYQTNGSY